VDHLQHRTVRNIAGAARDGIDFTAIGLDRVCTILFVWDGCALSRKNGIRSVNGRFHMRLTRGATRLRVPHLARAIAIASLMCVSGVGNIDTVYAQGGAKRQSIDIPSQRADSALKQFVELTKFQLIYPPELAKNFISKAVSGILTPREALERMIDETGVEIIDIGENSATLRSATLVPAGLALNVLSGPVETVLVTATKRTESQRDVPLAVTVLSTRALEDSGAVSFVDYAGKVPNLSFGYAGAGRQTARLFQIRGIFGQDTSAMYIGDTPIPTSVDPRVIGVDRIEALRGPQGSLFGARSMGGLLRIIPATPDVSKFFGKAHVGYGSIKEGATDTTADATLNIPFSEQVALRVTGYSINQGGFIDRRVDPDASMLIQATAGAATRVSGDEYLHKDVNKDRTDGTNPGE